MSSILADKERRYRADLVSRMNIGLMNGPLLPPDELNELRGDYMKELEIHEPPTFARNNNLIIENETMEPDAHIGKYYMLRAMQALKKLRGTNAGICLQKHLLAPMMSSAGT